MHHNILSEIKKQCKQKALLVLRRLLFKVLRFKYAREYVYRYEYLINSNIVTPVICFQAPIYYVELVIYNKYHILQALYSH